MNEKIERALKFTGAGAVAGGAAGALAGYFMGREFASWKSEIREASLAGAGLGVCAGAGLGAIFDRITRPSPGAMSDAKKVDPADAIKRKTVEIAVKELWKTMGRPGDVPWWLSDIRLAQDRDGNYFIEALISSKLPMDETGWPYGLPHDQDGVKVVAKRDDPNAIAPVKLGPVNG